MKLTIPFLTSFCFVICGCGGGGGGGGDTANTAIQKTYISSATAGEVIKYSLDTATQTYSYEILQSAYDLTGRKGSGTLTANSDGTFSPSESPTTKVLPLKNGLLLGNVKLNMGGNSRDVPIIGMENPLTASSELAGIYNFITLQCSRRSYGVYNDCDTFYGSVKVSAGASNTTATFTSCVGSNISNGCSNTAASGTLSYLSNGIWAMRESRSGNDSYFLAFKSPNGQKVGWIDFNDPAYFGFGQGIVSQQASITTASGISGSYIYKNTLGGIGKVSLTANPGNFQVTTSSGVTATANLPWDGFAKSASGFGLMAGNGVYVYMDRTIDRGYYEIGIQQ